MVFTHSCCCCSLQVKAMKRFFDIISSFIGMILLSPMIFIIGVIIFINDGLPILFKQLRMGKGKKEFVLYKFRTMTIQKGSEKGSFDAGSSARVTAIGCILRKSKLDELPQLWSILKGDMSLVGPRPALFNQNDLIKLRTERGIHHLVPGLTGLAQINGRDELSIPEKVKLDEEYLNRRSIFLDIKILAATFFGVLARNGISH